VQDFDTFNEQVASKPLDFATAAGGLSTYLGSRHVEFNRRTGAADPSVVAR